MPAGGSAVANRRSMENLWREKHSDPVSWNEPGEMMLTNNLNWNVWSGPTFVLAQ